MSVNYIQFENKYAYLNTEFGLNLACKWFNKTPEEIEEMVGRYKRGKRKGELKGKLSWYKVTQGGWVKMGRYDHDEGRSNGFVCRHNICFAKSIVDSWSGDLIIGFDDENRDVRQALADEYKEYMDKMYKQKHENEDKSLKDDKNE